MSTRPDSFMKIKKDWYRSDQVQSVLSHPSEKFILHLLVFQYCLDQESLEVYPSQKTIMEQTGYTRNTVKDAIKKFLTNKLLTEISETDKKNTYKSKTYKLNIPGYEGVQEETPTMKPKKRINRKRVKDMSGLPVHLMD